MNEEHSEEEVILEDDDNQTSNEANSESEGDDEAQGEGQEPESVTLTQAELDQKLKDRAKEQDKRWKDRLKKGGISFEEESEEKGGKEKSDKKEGNEEIIDRLNRSDLKHEGYADKKQQDAIIDYANTKGLEPLEALENPALQAVLKEMKTKSSTPRPSVRTGGQGGETPVETLVTRYKAGKKLTNDEFKKVKTHLRG